MRARESERARERTRERERERKRERERARARARARERLQLRPRLQRARFSHLTGPSRTSSRVERVRCATHRCGWRHAPVCATTTGVCSVAARLPPCGSHGPIHLETDPDRLAVLGWQMSSHGKGCALAHTPTLSHLHTHSLFVSHTLSLTHTQKHSLTHKHTAGVLQGDGRRGDAPRGAGDARVRDGVRRALRLARPDRGHPHPGP